MYQQPLPTNVYQHLLKQKNMFPMTFLCFLTILALAVKDCRRSLSKHLLLQLHLKHYKSVDVSLDRSITYWSKSTKIGKKVILRWMMTFWLSKEPVSQSHTHPAQPHQQEDQRPLPSLPYRATEKSLTLSQSYWYKCEAFIVAPQWSIQEAYVGQMFL